MVTVVLSTYNRSKVLQHAIKSVLWQTYQDFELLVIGDRCTDDSEEVVTSFKDDRLQWINLPINHGNQYGPNNHGLQIAKGYIAYHSHDDVWYSTHLEDLMKIMGTGVDVAHSLGIQKLPDGQNVIGLYSGEFNHDIYCLASGIIMHTKEIGEKVGGWSNPWEISLPVDQDFIRKMVNAGAKFGCTHRPTAIKIPAINRDKFYQQVGDYDKPQRELINTIETDPHFMDSQLAWVHGTPPVVKFNSSWHWSPKGEFINASRENRGLPFMERVTWE